jgi:hypothetical protein
MDFISKKVKGYMTEKKKFIFYVATYPAEIYRAISTRKCGDKAWILAKYGMTSLREEWKKKQFSPIDCAKAREKELATGNADELLHIFHIELPYASFPNGDKDIHKLLINAGRRNTEGKGGKEWFPTPVTCNNDILTRASKCNVDDLKIVFDEISADVRSFIEKQDAGSSKQSLKLRESQQRNNAIWISAINEAQASKQHAFHGIDDACPRYGKTIGSIELFRQLDNRNLMIVPAWWLSPHTSYEGELSKYKEFKDIVFCDQRVPGWQQKLSSALEHGQKVLLTVSMHITDPQKELAYVTDVKDECKFVYVEEADVGAWTKQSAQVCECLLNGKSGMPIIINGSGSNLQKLAWFWANQNAKIDFVLSTTYTHLRRWDANSTIERRFYVVDNLSGDFSWSRVSKEPQKHARQLKDVARSLIGDGDKHAISLRTIMKKQPTCFICFFNADNQQLEEIRDIFKREMHEYVVKSFNSNTTTNRDVEQTARETIACARRDGKTGVVFITNRMGSRSFSISEIECSVLCMNDVPIQLSARPLTPGVLFDGSQKEHAYVVSLSTDIGPSGLPEDICAMLVDEAAKISKRECVSYLKALREWVLPSANIFIRNKADGYVPIKPENVLYELSQKKSLMEVADHGLDVNAILDDPEWFLNRVRDVKPPRNIRTKKLSIPTYHHDAPKRQTNNVNKDVDKSELKEIVRRIAMVNRMSSVVSRFSRAGDGKTFKERVRYIADDAKCSENFYSAWKMTPQAVLDILDRRVLQEVLLDTICMLVDAEEAEIRRELWHETTI